VRSPEGVPRGADVIIIDTDDIAPDSISARLRAKGFRLDRSYLPSCRVVTGPNGEVYGHLTANECAEKFLGDQDAPLSDALSNHQLKGISDTVPAAAIEESGRVTRGTRAGLRSRGAQ